MERWGKLNWEAVPARVGKCSAVCVCVDLASLSLMDKQPFPLRPSSSGPSSSFQPRLCLSLAAGVALSVFGRPFSSCTSTAHSPVCVCVIGLLESHSFAFPVEQPNRNGTGGGEILSQTAFK